MKPDRALYPPIPATTMDDPLRLSTTFHDVLQRYAGQTVEVGTLVRALEGRGFGVLLILFTLPLAIPLPKPPPLDTVLGLPLLYLCIQMIRGNTTPHLPPQIMQRKVPVDFLIKAFSHGRGWLEKLESKFSPRLQGMDDTQALRICGVLGLISTASVVVPFPFSNTIPSISMMVMAIALMMRDKLAAIIAALCGVAWVGLLVIAFLFGAHYVFEWLGALWS